MGGTPAASNVDEHNNGETPLRTAGKALLPPTIQQGEKRGFGIPLDDWFREPSGHDFVRNRLLSVRAKERGLWDVPGVEKVLDAHQTRQGRNFGEILWRLLILDAWARHYLDDTTFLQGPLSVWVYERRDLNETLYVFCCTGKKISPLSRAAP